MDSLNRIKPAQPYEGEWYEGGGCDVGSPGHYTPRTWQFTCSSRRQAGVNDVYHDSVTKCRSTGS
jgi:hypothetical protein